MINTHLLELPLPRTSFHGLKGVRPIEILLYIAIKHNRYINFGEGFGGNGKEEMLNMLSKNYLCNYTILISLSNFFVKAMKKSAV